MSTRVSNSSSLTELPCALLCAEQMAAETPRGRDSFRLIEDAKERNAQLAMPLRDWLASEVYDACDDDIQTWFHVLPNIAISECDPAVRLKLNGKVSDLLLPADYKCVDARGAPTWADVEEHVDWVFQNTGRNGVVAKAFLANNPEKERDATSSEAVNFTYIWEWGTRNRLRSGMMALFGHDLATETWPASEASADAGHAAAATVAGVTLKAAAAMTRRRIKRNAAKTGAVPCSHASHTKGGSARVSCRCCCRRRQLDAIYGTTSDDTTSV